MKLKINEFGGSLYVAPEIETVEIATEGVLCYSTEQMEEDDINPWI